MVEPLQLLTLALLWAGYFGTHSLLASHGCKRWCERRWPRLAQRYRLAYNLIAVLLLIPPLALTHALAGPPLWRWEGIWKWVADGLAVAALAGFWLASRAYDMPSFLGLKPQPPIVEGAPLGLSPLHRHVRHPWYSLGLVLIWTRDMDAAFLTTALCITLYLIVGSRLEDAKLEKEIGEAYRRYRAAVPGLIPRLTPWRDQGETG